MRDNDKISNKAGTVCIKGNLLMTFDALNLKGLLLLLLLYFRANNEAWKMVPHCRY